METIKKLIDGVLGWPKELKLMLAVIFGLLLIIKIGEIILEVKKERRMARLGMSEVDELSGVDFELFIQLMLERLKYQKVQLTPKTADYGIDVTATDPEGKKVGFQCKRYKKNVGIKAVQEANSGRSVYGLEQVYVITNSFYTQNARKAAAANEVKLIDRNELMDMIELSQKELATEA